MSFTKAKAYLESVGFADHIIEPEADVYKRQLYLPSKFFHVQYTKSSAGLFYDPIFLKFF